MSFYQINKEDFYVNLFEKNKVSKRIDSILLSDNQAQIFKNKNKKLDKSDIAQLELVPDYFTLKLFEPLTSKKVFQKKGYAINLSEFSSSEHYIKTTCSTNFKKNVTRCINRLETCFDINYSMFFGEIQSEEYQFLMGCLNAMITKRFQHRSGRNKVIENWGYYLKTAFYLVNSKNASLFVIYNAEEPIEISLNFHFENIMYSAISSYNMEYSKFSLGNVEIYKQLDWCLGNNITYFDMGYGDLEYKKSWANLIYNFETHIMSAPKNKWALLYSKYLSYKYKTVNYLISKNINNKINHLKKRIKGEKEETKIKEVKYKTELVNLTTIEIDSFLNVTNQLNKTLEFLKRPIYDFLYSNIDHINNINIYRIDKELNIYLITGKKIQLKIEIVN